MNLLTLQFSESPYLCQTGGMTERRERDERRTAAPTVHAPENGVNGSEWAARCDRVANGMNGAVNALVNGIPTQPANGSRAQPANGTNAPAAAPTNVPATPPGRDRAQRLIDRAREAAQLRAYQTDPDVVALQVERVRRIVDRLVWTSVLLGLAFTAVNVQMLAADGAPTGSPAWLSAWLLDPMVSLLVIGILLAESVTSRWQIRTGPWVRAAKWGALAATYAMNTWQSWVQHSPVRILLHSIPPAIVLLAVEAITDLRERLTEAILVAARAAQERVERSTANDGASQPAAVQRSPRKPASKRRERTPVDVDAGTATNDQGPVNPAAAAPNAEVVPFAEAQRSRATAQAGIDPAKLHAIKTKHKDWRTRTPSAAQCAAVLGIGKGAVANAYRQALAREAQQQLAPEQPADSKDPEPGHAAIA